MIEVAPSATKAVARVVLVEARLGSYVVKRAIPMVAHHEVRRPVLRVVVGRRILILVRALVKSVEAKMDVEPTVAVIIRHRRAGKSSLWRIRKDKGVRLLPKLSSALVQEQHRAGGLYDNQILPPIIVDVDNKRARRVLDDADSRSFGNVLKCSIAAIPIKPVRKTAGLAHIEIVKSITIDVANRNAIMSVDIDATSAIEHRSPIIRSVQKLRRIGRIATERRSRNIDIAWGSGPALRLFHRLPVSHPELTRCRSLPIKLPIAHTLLAVEVSTGAHQFKANASLQLDGR